jgi:hypothetical protein
MNVGAEIDRIRVKLKKLKVCWSIECQNAQIQNQEPNWKRRQTLELIFELGRDEIKLILKIKTSIKDLID